MQEHGPVWQVVIKIDDKPEDDPRLMTRVFAEP